MWKYGANTNKFFNLDDANLVFITCLTHLDRPKTHSAPVSLIFLWKLDKHMLEALNLATNTIQ